MPSDDRRNDAADRATSAAAAASPIIELAERAGSAVGLRKMLIANPGLAQQIAAYFATGAEAPALNDLMAQ